MADHVIAFFVGAGGSAVTFLSAKFGPGMLDAAGSMIFKSLWDGMRKRLGFKEKRKSIRRVDDKVTIGILETKVKNLINWKNSITKELRDSKRRETKCAKNHENCVKSLAEARAQITDLYLWKKSVEKKIG